MNNHEMFSIIPTTKQIILRSTFILIKKKKICICVYLTKINDLDHLTLKTISNCRIFQD